MKETMQKIRETGQSVMKKLREHMPSMEGVKRLWRSKFSQKMLVTSTMVGCFGALLPLTYPVAVGMMVIKGGFPLGAALSYGAGVLGVIGATGTALSAALDLVQYGFKPDKPMRHVNGCDQTVEGPRRHVLQLLNLELQVSSLSSRLANNPGNEKTKAALRDVFARADRLMPGVKVLDAGSRGAGAEKFEYKLACDRALLG